jgi:hypothetical protein
VGVEPAIDGDAGTSIQARDGADRARLQVIAAAAMCAWPGRGAVG